LFSRFVLWRLLTVACSWYSAEYGGAGGRRRRLHCLQVVALHFCVLKGTASILLGGGLSRRHLVACVVGAIACKQ
jgi:hypothetical protein